MRANSGMTFWSTPSSCMSVRKRPRVPGRVKHESSSWFSSGSVAASGPSSSAAWAARSRAYGYRSSCSRSAVAKSRTSAAGEAHLADVPLRQERAGEELGEPGDLEPDPGEPERGLEVAQAPLRLLHVRLERSEEHT